MPRRWVRHDIDERWHSSGDGWEMRELERAFGMQADVGRQHHLQAAIGAAPAAVALALRVVVVVHERRRGQGHRGAAGVCERRVLCKERHERAHWHAVRRVGWLVRRGRAARHGASERRHVRDGCQARGAVRMTTRQRCQHELVFEADWTRAGDCHDGGCDGRGVRAGWQ